jgi:hypothetical protein
MYNVIERTIIYHDGRGVGLGPALLIPLRLWRVVALERRFLDVIDFRRWFRGVLLGRVDRITTGENILNGRDGHGVASGWQFDP